MSTEPELRRVWMIVRSWSLSRDSRVTLMFGCVELKSSTCALSCFSIAGSSAIPTSRLTLPLAVELAAALPDAAAEALPAAALPDAAVDALAAGAELAACAEAACGVAGEAPAPPEQAATSPTVASSVAIRFIDFPPPTPDDVSGVPS